MNSISVVKLLENHHSKFFGDSNSSRSEIPSSLSYAFIFSQYLEKLSRSLGINTSAPEGSIEAWSELSELFQSQLFLVGQGVLNTLPSKVNKDFSFEVSSKPESLGFVYERFLFGGCTKKQGVFYTPESVAQTMIERIIPDHVDTKRVLDPACGGGVFLVLSLRYLHSLKNTDPTLIAMQSIYGVDLDQTALEVTKLSLQFEMIRLGVEPKVAAATRLNLARGNSLLEPSDYNLTSDSEKESCKESGAICWETTFPKAISEGGFHAILGNPPYGISREERISPSENKKLKEVYSKLRNGKINTYMLFLAKGYSMLHNNGAMALIVPNSWLGIRGGASLRNFFLQNKALTELTVYESPVFKGVSVEAVVAVISKNKSSDSVVVNRRKSYKSKEPRISYRIPYSSCTDYLDGRIPTIWAPSAATIFQKISAESILIDSESSPFQASIALQAYARGKGNPPQSKEDVASHSFHYESKFDGSTFPYLEGKDIQRFSVDWSGGYLRHGPWLAEPQDLDRFSGPRVLVREILHPQPYVLSAATVTDTMLYNKSVLHIRARKDLAEETAWALTGILNSRLSSFIIGFRGCKSQRRTFPKIVAEDLHKFPIPKNLVKNDAGVAEIAKEISFSKQRRLNSNKLQQELDRKVCKLYNLDTKHQKTIEDGLNELIAIR